MNLHYIDKLANHFSFIKNKINYKYKLLIIMILKDKINKKF